MGTHPRKQKHLKKAFSECNQINSIQPYLNILKLQTGLSLRRSGEWDLCMET
jgi:hypothetical protein